MTSKTKHTDFQNKAHWLPKQSTLTSKTKHTYFQN